MEERAWSCSKGCALGCALKTMCMHVWRALDDGWMESVMVAQGHHRSATRTSATR